MTKPIQQNVPILSRRDLGNSYFSIVCGPFKGIKKCRPGHFVHVRIPSGLVYFRRAMSIAAVDIERETVEFIFKVFGRGTTLLSGLGKNDQLDILGPLGQPFRRPAKNETVLLVGGGIGFPPPYYLACDLVERGYDRSRLHFFYGGRTGKDLVERNRIKKLGISFHPVTDDGSFGQKGLVTHYVEELLGDGSIKHPRIYACGPEPMLKAVDDLASAYAVPGQLSLEAPMPCGMGICLGCVVVLKAGGHARVCVEGPVFEVGEVVL